MRGRTLCTAAPTCCGRDRRRIGNRFRRRMTTTERAGPRSRSRGLGSPRPRQQRGAPARCERWPRQPRDCVGAGNGEGGTCLLGRRTADGRMERYFGALGPWSAGSTGPQFAVRAYSTSGRESATVAVFSAHAELGGCRGALGTLLAGGEYRLSMATTQSSVGRESDEISVSGSFGRCVVDVEVPQKCTGRGCGGN